MVLQPVLGKADRRYSLGRILGQPAYSRAACVAVKKMCGYTRESRCIVEAAIWDQEIVAQMTSGRGAGDGS